MKKTYLADGVYADNDGFQIVLTADSGGQTNTIYMEPNVFEALLRYAERFYGIEIKTDKSETKVSG